jgi:hypothetical protein
VSAEHFGALVRSLSDEQLEMIGFRQGDARRDVAWVVKLVMRHIEEHRPGILGAIAGDGHATVSVPRPPPSLRSRSNRSRKGVP